MSLHPDRILDTFSCWISFWALLYQVSCLCVFLRSVLLFSRVCVDILSRVDWTFKHSTVLCVQFCYFKMLLQSVHRTPLVSSTYRLYLQMSCGSRIVVEKRCGFLAVQCRQVVSLLSWSSRLLSSERCTLLSKQCRQVAFCGSVTVILFQSLALQRAPWSPVGTVSSRRLLWTWRCYRVPVASTPPWFDISLVTAAVVVLITYQRTKREWFVQNVFRVE